MLVVALINGFFTLGIYSWMPVWLPELYPTRSRATGIAFAFNAPRFVAFLGPLFAGALIVEFFGGFSRTAMIFASIYILGFVVAPFLPETRGQPLPVWEDHESACFSSALTYAFAGAHVAVRIKLTNRFVKSAMTGLRKSPI